MEANNILKKIVQIPFGHYVKEEFKKTQIVLHHTVSGGSAEAVANYWNTLKGRVGTCIIIEKDGTPYQLFSSKYWAGHVGGRSSMTKEFNKFNLPYRNCSKHAIGIELVSWGALQEVGDKYYNAYGGEYKSEPYIIPSLYRGFGAFDPYTPEQIQTLKELLIFWNDRYNIPLDYDEDMWDINEAALSNRKGVYAHTSFRSDKSDLFPQKELIEMLKGLTRPGINGTEFTLDFDDDYNGKNIVID